MVIQAGALVLLAAALVFWPRSLAVLRLQRAINVVDPNESPPGARSAWRLPGWPRSRGLRVLLIVGAVVAFAQIWPLPVAAVAIAVTGTALAALVRGVRERAVVREEQAAVEGLGVLVAELRAGRTPEAALAAAGQHCGHPGVGALLRRLGRFLRLGDRLDGWLDASAGVPCSEWQIRLLSGVRLSSQTGCALADVLAAVESDLSRRGSQRTDVRATAAGHRATVGLLAGLPILGLMMGSGIGAEPVRILTTTTIGQILLVTGVALELLGLAWSRGLTGRALRGS